MGPLKNQTLVDLGKMKNDEFVKDLVQQRKWKIGLAACKIFSAISLLNLYGSVYFLSFMSIGECFTWLIFDENHKNSITWTKVTH